MSSVFDPAAFLSATITEADVKRPPLPTESGEGDSLYTATIGEIKPGKNGNREDGTPWMTLAIPFKIEVPAGLQTALKLPPQVTLTDRPFLDLTASGQMDNSPGRNTRRRQLREATDLNSPGTPFSWNMLVGRVVKVKIGHRLYNNEIQEEVLGVFRA